MYFKANSNFNLENHLKTFSPKKISGFRFNPIHYSEILSILNEIAAEKPWLVSDEGYIPISGKKLKKEYRGYQYYLRHAIESGIIETDNQYIKGKKCKGYRFTLENILSDGNHSEIQYQFQLLKRKYVGRPLPAEYQTDYGFLTKWFTPSLQIDYSKATSFIEAEYLKAKEEFNRSSNELEFRKKHYRYLRSAAAIERIQQHQYNFNVDDTINRFYSTLTIMPKELRHFLSYNGEKLVSLDLKNSQPFILTSLLNDEFWRTVNNEKINYTNLNNSNSTYLSNNLNTIKIIMVDSFNKCDFKNEIRKYSELVSKGNLYKVIYAGHVLRNGYEIISEKDFKDECLKGFFADNRYMGGCVPFKILRSYFPTIYSIIQSLKRIDKVMFSHILQNIESVLFLLRICRKIEIQYPLAPFYTIHDNIITTEFYCDSILELMKSEIRKSIGIEPSFGKDVFNISAIQC